MSFYTFLPQLLNMSLTASVVIVFVLLLRLMLKRTPKVISYALWGIVLIRLLCPVSIESNFSLFGLMDAPVEEQGELTSSIEYVPNNIVHTEYPTVVLPVPGVSDVINDALPKGDEQLRADPLEGPIFLATYVWMAGVLAMAVYAAVSYQRLRRNLLTAIHLRDNIWSADGITSPFVMGLFRPKIYLPNSMEQRELSYIILHEQYHIRRFDHIIKAVSFVALCIHWFNPLVWVAFIMAGKDMEMSCDEAVVKKMGEGVLADYTASLLSLATGKHIIAGMPLAFGEGDTKGRIRNLANWKKPAFWVILMAVIACAVLAVCLLTNPVQSQYNIKIVIPAGSEEAFVYSEEEISPQRNYIVISSGDNLGDTEVVLKAVEVTEENAYEPTYLTPGMPVEMYAEKDAWFKIGVNVQNPTDTDKVVYVTVSPVEVRIADTVVAEGLEQYRTDYIGDAVNVSKIAQRLPYPQGYSYSSIELQTSTEPYEMKVYLNVEDGAWEWQTAFRSCADTAFGLIGNMGVISFHDRDTGEILHSFERTEVKIGAISGDLIPGTTYVSYQCIYMNPLSSYAAFGGDSGCIYTVGKDFFETVDRNSGAQNLIDVQRWEWKPFPYTDEEWAALYIPEMNAISNISEVYDEIQ